MATITRGERASALFAQSSLSEPDAALLTKIREAFRHNVAFLIDYRGAFAELGVKNGQFTVEASNSEQALDLVAQTWREAHGRLVDAHMGTCSPEPVVKGLDLLRNACSRLCPTFFLAGLETALYTHKRGKLPLRGMAWCESLLDNTLFWHFLLDAGFSYKERGRLLESDKKAFGNRISILIADPHNLEAKRDIQAMYRRCLDQEALVGTQVIYSPMKGEDVELAGFANEPPLVVCKEVAIDTYYTYMNRSYDPQTATPLSGAAEIIASVLAGELPSLMNVPFVIEWERSGMQTTMHAFREGHSTYLELDTKATIAIENKALREKSGRDKLLKWCRSHLRKHLTGISAQDAKKYIEEKWTRLLKAENILNAYDRPNKGWDSESIKLLYENTLSFVHELLTYQDVVDQHIDLFLRSVMNDEIVEPKSEELIGMKVIIQSLIYFPFSSVAEYLRKSAIFEAKGLAKYIDKEVAEIKAAHGELISRNKKAAVKTALTMLLTFNLDPHPRNILLHNTTLAPQAIDFTSALPIDPLHYFGYPRHGTHTWSILDSTLSQEMLDEIAAINAPDLIRRLHALFANDPRYRDQENLEKKLCVLEANIYRLQAGAKENLTLGQIIALHYPKVSLDTCFSMLVEAVNNDILITRSKGDTDLAKQIISEKIPLEKKHLDLFIVKSPTLCRSFLREYAEAPSPFQIAWEASNQGRDMEAFKDVIGDLVKAPREDAELRALAPLQIWALKQCGLLTP